MIVSDILGKFYKTANCIFTVVCTTGLEYLKLVIGYLCENLPITKLEKHLVQNLLQGSIAPVWLMSAVLLIMADPDSDSDHHQNVIICF